MPRGKWSFLHEWVIYEYLSARFSEGTLRLRLKVKAGKLELRERWKKIVKLEPIVGTTFPDVDSIRLSGGAGEFPAEVKFTTSLFDYHRKEVLKYQTFRDHGGAIIVLSHDYIPPGLEGQQIDVYEIDQIDFIAFCRENFVRLLNRQIRQHTETKVWVMYQGPNFNKGTSETKPARESGIWCPTENLSGFDLAIGDRILFVKTRGASTQQVQRAYHGGTTPKEWLLDEIYVGELVSTIYSRGEYCQRKKIPRNTQLWVKDQKRNQAWRWNRVFEFKHIKTLRSGISMKKLKDIPELMEFVSAVTEAFCYQRSREITLQEYRDLLEYLIPGTRRK